jgi:hypothetical protein
VERGVVAVRVTATESGRPIAGAEVGVFFVTPRAAGASSFEAEATLRVGRTDAAGRGVVEELLEAGAEREILVVARARGCKEKRPSRFHLRPGEPPPPPVLLRTGGNVEIEVALERGVTIEGRVADASGRAIAGVHLSLVLSDVQSCSWPHAFHVSRRAGWPPHCTSGPDGSYEWLSFPIEFARESSHWVLVVRDDEHAAALIQRVEQIVPDEDGVVRADVVLPDGVACRGVVRRPDGSPAAGAAVRLWQDPEVGQPVCVSIEKGATTDAEGRFTVTGLKRTRHQVLVEMGGCAPVRTAHDLAAVPMPPLEIALEPGCDVTGILLDRDSRPVEGADVHGFVREPFASRETKTDAAGRFVLRGLPMRGRLELRAGAHVKTEVELPAPPLTLLAPPFVELAIEVRSEEDDRPLAPPGAVSIFAPGFSTRAQLEANGTVRRPEMPAGRYEFWIDVPDREPARLSAELPEGGLQTPIVLRVGRGGTVHGRVVDAADKPLAGVRVRAFGELPNRRRETTTDGDGRFELRGLARTAWLAFVEPGFALRGVPVEATGSFDRPAVVDVTLEVGVRIAGRVVRRDGTPHARALVKATKNERAWIPVELPSALSDEQGRFVLEHVPAGAWVVATADASVAVTVANGASVEVELREGEAPSAAPGSEPPAIG